MHRAHQSCCLVRSMPTKLLLDVRLLACNAVTPAVCPLVIRFPVVSGINPAAKIAAGCKAATASITTSSLSARHSMSENGLHQSCCPAPTKLLPPLPAYEPFWNRPLPPPPPRPRPPLRCPFSCSPPPFCMLLWPLLPPLPCCDLPLPLPPPPLPPLPPLPLHIHAAEMQSMAISALSDWRTPSATNLCVKSRTTNPQRL